jgi:hypothetical protein
MKITREETEEWNYPCFGRGKNGDVVWFAEKGMGPTVVGDVRYSGPWDMTCFKPIYNPFEEKVEKFKPIKIVLETKEEAEAMYKAMDECKEIEGEDLRKLANLLD